MLGSALGIPESALGIPESTLGTPGSTLGTPGSDLHRVDGYLQCGLSSHFFLIAFGLLL